MNLVGLLKRNKFSGTQIGEIREILKICRISPICVPKNPKIQKDIDYQNENKC